MAKKIIRYIGLVSKAMKNIFKGNIIFGIQFIYRLHIEIIHKIFRIRYQKKLIKIRIQGTSLIIYNSLVSYLVMDEIWTENLYKRFEGCKKILDLGGYLGESAIYFNQKIGAKVDIYEPDKRNFAVLSKNCGKYGGIHCFEGAVMASRRDFRIIYDNIDRGSITENKGEKIKTFNFFDIINKNKYDGLKIDIEGGEYEILDKIIIKKILPKRKMIFIEFHDINKEINIKKILGYISYLTGAGYIFEIFDNGNHLTPFTKIIKKNDKYINIAFKKVL